MQRSLPEGKRRITVVEGGIAFPTPSTVEDAKTHGIVMANAVIVVLVDAERLERKYELKALGYDLDALANHVEGIFDMDKGEIYSPGKYRRLIKPRSVFCYWAVRELGETATSLARRLGLTQSGVSKSVLRGKGIIEDMNLKLIE